MNRKSRFLVGLVFVTALFALPMIVATSVNAIWWLLVFATCYSLAVYQIHRMTIRNIKPKYPLVNPEGHPDIYSGRIPRPIHEDMEKYPWFFNKKKHQRKLRKTNETPNGENTQPTCKELNDESLTKEKEHFRSFMNNQK